MSGLDWAGMMRAGLSVLRLQPAQFWGLSPAELMIMLGHGDGGAQGSAPMAQEGLRALMAAFPDETAGPAPREPKPEAERDLPPVSGAKAAPASRFVQKADLPSIPNSPPFPKEH